MGIVASTGRHKMSVKRTNLKIVFHKPCQAFKKDGIPKKVAKTTVANNTKRAGATSVNVLNNGFLDDWGVT
jgi:hypothetical protein